MASGVTCIQRLDGLRDSAIQTKYHISLRSSSMREPRYPLPRVILFFREMPRMSVLSLLEFLGAIRAGVCCFAGKWHPPPPEGPRVHS
ncbi:hypothetical protein LOK49_LG13G00013 [Camellia lanceoleosa]|uniref:Uncharacterized protein n=1 Tax=Camellia lanceoleosa TaxID=1840588 RepID=A0ACC0FGV3_9ERIC|nr:hypothetical protein LOK49_LG13G00013 [Camellia lanceoleosa]